MASALCYTSGEEGLSGDEPPHSGPHVSLLSLNQKVLADACVHTGQVKPQSFPSPWYLLLQYEVQLEFTLLKFLKHFESDFKLWIHFKKVTFKCRNHWEKY